MENSEFRAFWAVIPATVLDDEELPANAKILYGVLSSLMRREGYCWATNAQLAEAMHCSEDVITRWVSKLSKRGHIRITIIPDREWGGQRRCVYPAIPEPPSGVVSQGSDKNPTTPGQSSEVQRTEVRDPLGQTSEVLYIDKNKNKKRKGKAPASAVVSSLFLRCDQYGMEVAQAMQRFLTMRSEIGKPLESEQAATMLWNKLMNLSAGSPAHMVALLTKATERQWRTIFQLDEDELSELHPARREVETGGVRFL